MILHKTFGYRAAAAAALMAGASLACTAALAQTWEYKSYKRGAGGQFNKDDFIAGSISVEEKDGKAWFRMSAGRTDICLRGAQPVSLSRDDAATTIEFTDRLSGCDEFRYVIRNDGSGGERQVKRSDRWVSDGYDHGLTPKN